MTGEDAPAGERTGGSRRGGERSRSRGAGSDRGQVVLLAAAVVVVALVPMLLAYAQLGYDGGVAGGEVRATPEADVQRLLHRAVFAAAAEVDGEFAWGNRTGATARANAMLAPRVRSAEAVGAADGAAVTVEQNASAASEWAAENCPSGPMRRFGTCETAGGLVVQERASEVTLLAAAYDVRVDATDRTVRLTRVVEAV